MLEADDGASLRRRSPPTPQKCKTDSEEEPRELLKDEDHSEEESKEIEDDDDDGSPWRHSSPPLLDMIDFPPSLTLPPTPPLPSSPRDFDMEQQDSDEDDGPPPGWDNKYQLKEQVEQLVTLAATSAVSSDIHIQKEDARKDAHNEEGEPLSQAHPCLPPEVAPSVEEQDSEYDGPPPGWDSKCQPEPKLQKTDMKMEDALQDAQNEEGQPIPEVPSDIIVDREDSEDDGSPQGWDSKCQLEPKLQKTPQSDMKMEDTPQDAQNEKSQPTPEVPSDIIVDREDSEDDGPPPGWDSKCQPEPKLQKTPQSDSSDIIKIKQDARSENGPQSQSQSQSCSSSAPELVPSDTKVDEQDSEDDGPPPGWNSKCPTPPSDFKNEEDKEHAPGWGSTPQQQPSLQSPIVQSGTGTGYEPNNNVKVIEESFQQHSRQQPIHPIKPQISVPKPPMTMNNPEMGQMVCGSCRHLLSYPKGARYVECACCLEENYVLEEHEVGQVVCNGCHVLLMYPYGAPKVRCASCRSETEIGDQNRRPPLSEHKRRARQHLKCVHAS